jgi:hypothetical protein
MWNRLLPLAALIVAGLSGLTGAFPFPLSHPAPTLALPPNVPDAAAGQTIERAVAAMAPERLGCLETKLWQKVTLPNLTYEARGRFLMGPQRRFRTELQTKQDNVVTTRLTVGDGAMLWEANRLAGGDWERVTKVDLAGVIAVLDRTEKGEFLRWDFLQGPRFGGVAPLLTNLQKRLLWVKMDNVQHGGKARLRLTGVWKADFAKYVAEGRVWPVGLPEQCRLDLDPISLWPYRLEWWGPATEGAADTLLAQLEFRDPIIHTELSPERCAKEFTFNPGKTPVVDQTDAVKAEFMAKLTAP